MAPSIDSIPSSQLTVVIQGAVSKDETTADLLKAIRHYLPDARSILSTWDHCSVEGLDADEIILLPMPPAEIVDPEVDPTRANNLGRQILSTIQGLSAVKTEYALKIRTDAKLLGNQILEHLGKKIESDTLGLGFKERILLGRFFTVSYVQSKTLFSFSDIWMAGRTEDLLKIWNVPTPDEPQFTNYIKLHPEKARKESEFPCRFVRCIPEQYIWSSLFQNQGVFLEETHDTRISWVFRHIILLNNHLWILEQKDSQIALPTHLSDKENAPYNLPKHVRKKPISLPLAWLLALSAYLVVTIGHWRVARAFQQIIFSLGFRI